MHIVNLIALVIQLIATLIEQSDCQVFSYLPEGQTAKRMPCCKESIGRTVCVEMSIKKPYEFRRKCRNDVDFGMIQCCKTCRTNVAQLGRELFAHGPNSRHCFDRHNRKYCSHFVRRSGMWATFSADHSGCNGENAALAFRVCRRSCGFCRVSLYEDDRNESHCKKKRPVTTTESPPSSLIGFPDRAADSYLERIIDEIDDDYRYSKQHS